MGFSDLNPHEQALVTALRSGRYEQTMGTLRRNPPTESYCCLGVACEISGLGMWINGTYRIGDSSEGGYLHPIVQKQLGWATSCGSLTCKERDYDFPVNLAHLNDTGITFDQIADLIEAGLIMYAEKEN